MGGFEEGGSLQTVNAVEEVTAPLQSSITARGNTIIISVSHFVFLLFAIFYVGLCGFVGADYMGCERADSFRMVYAGIGGYRRR